MTKIILLLQTTHTKLPIQPDFEEELELPIVNKRISSEIQQYKDWLEGLNKIMSNHVPPVKRKRKFKRIKTLPNMFFVEDIASI